MIRLLVLAFVLLPPAGWQPIGRAGITGVVRSSGEPVQGATVTVAGVGANARAVIREDGAFTFPDLVDGEYLVTIELAGFQTERRTVSVHQGVAPGLALPLRLATLEHVDFVVWPLPQSLARADAVAHLRIEQTEPSGRCGGTVGATHLARVLSVAKGSLPASIRFGQVNAGSCLEDDGRVIRIRSDSVTGGRADRLSDRWTGLLQQPRRPRGDAPHRGRARLWGGTLVGANQDRHDRRRGLVRAPEGPVNPKRGVPRHDGPCHLR